MSAPSVVIFICDCSCSAGNLSEYLNHEGPSFTGRQGHKYSLKKDNAAKARNTPDALFFLERNKILAAVTVGKSPAGP